MPAPCLKIKCYITYSFFRINIMSGHTKKYHQNIIATILKETTIYVALFLHSINIVKFIKKVQETLFSLISLKHNDKDNFKYYIKITGF